MIRLPKWTLVILAVALVLSLATPALAAETKGKIKSIDQGKNEFVLTDVDNKDWTFQMDEKATVSVNDQQDKKLADLKAGDEAIITYTTKGAKLIASEIRCKRK